MFILNDSPKTTADYYYYFQSELYVTMSLFPNT